MIKKMSHGKFVSITFLRTKNGFDTLEWFHIIPHIKETWFMLNKKISLLSKNMFHKEINMICVGVNNC